jgi:Tol biopolymer transport system component
LVSSTGIDGNPDYSPDGSNIAFESNRSGSPEIWVSDAGGGNARALTNLQVAVTGSPRWSPNGDAIAFDSIAGGELAVYVVNAGGGEPQRIALGMEPDWSADGQSLYYGCGPAGLWDLCRVPAAGGDPVRLTTSGGSRPQISPDGQWIYFSKPRQGLWRMRVSGGVEEQVIVAAGLTGWAIGKDGVYFVQGPSHNTDNRIQYRDFRTGGTSHVYTIEGSPIYAWLSLSPDGRSILYDQFEQASSDIMLVENFR